jgi:Ca-activated chloride channel family protein
MRWAALIALVVGLAGFRWPDRGSRISTEGIAIQLLVDCSGSMADKDFEWKDERISRLEAVKRVFELFVAGGDGPGGEHLEGRRNDLIGLVTFAHRPDPGCPLTLSHSALLKQLKKQEPRIGAGEAETNITDAIIIGVNRLNAAAPKTKVMVLLSDGEHNVPDTAYEAVQFPGQAANLARSLHIPIYTIDAGGDTSAHRETGIQTLRDVAKITGGEYFQAHDSKSLLDVCGQIDRRTRSEIQSYQYSHYFDWFPWLGLGAFVLFVCVNALEMTFWQRLP